MLIWRKLLSPRNLTGVVTDPGAWCCAMALLSLVGMRMLSTVPNEGLGFVAQFVCVLGLVSGLMLGPFLMRRSDMD